MSGQKTDITIEDCMKGAFHALLRGDLAERDRLCAMAQRAFEQAGSEALPGDTSVIIDKGKQS